MRDKIRSYLKISTILGAFLIIFSYAYIEARSIIKGPNINIDFPKNGETLKKGIINVSGTAENASFIYLNGRPIYTDSKGNFSEKIILSNGYNSILVKASDRIGKEKEKTLEIIMEENISSTTKDSLAQKAAEKTL